MDFGKLVERVKMICTSPQTEWPVIEKEQTSLQELYMGYILILAAIGPVAGFLKMSVFGIHVPLMGTYRPGLGAGIGGMVFRYIMTLAGVYLVALIVNMMAPSFGGKKDDMQALKTVAYAYTAAWVAGIAPHVPWAGWLILLAGSVYSVYLLYLGLPVTMKCPPEKAVGYTAVSIIVAINRNNNGYSGIAHGFLRRTFHSDGQSEVEQIDAVHGTGQQNKPPCPGHVRGDACDPGCGISIGNGFQGLHIVLFSAERWGHHVDYQGH